MTTQQAEPNPSSTGKASADIPELQRALRDAEGGKRWLRRALLAAAVVLLLAVGVVVRIKSRPPPPPRYVAAEVVRGDVAERVQATGAVQPVLQVTVGAQANGRVLEVPVDFNSQVKKGDLLAVLDPMVATAQVNQNQANLLAQQAQIESARANLAAARVAYERTQRLHAQNLAAKGDLDTARGQYEVAEAQVRAAEAQTGAVRAQLDQAKTNQGFTKIYSPVDGVVITRSIDPGATVVASFQAPSLFVIAQDLKLMRVMADIDEADVGKLREGSAAEATVDAFPGEIFAGIVQQVRFSPTTTQGVVTYAAVVQVDNPEEKLRPGMTATVSIRTREAKDVVRVPNAALRFKPTPPLGPDGKPVVSAPLPPLGKGEGRVHVLLDATPGAEKEELRVVQIGATDGITTEIVSGLQVGDKVITDELDDASGKDPKGKRKPS